MPGGDGTGPTKQGPMTGGGLGPRGAGRGRGRGACFGRKQGQRHRRWALDWWDRAGAPRSPASERDELQRDEAALETELQLIKERIAELDQP